MDTNERPLVLAGYSLAVLNHLSKTFPPRSLIFVEEPDVLRKRNVRATTTEAAALRELIDWECHLDTADAFYHRHRDLRPAGVIPITEYAVPFAARLAERYGLPGAGYGAARALRDKSLLRSVTSAAGIPNPRSVAVSGPAQVTTFLAETGGPIVLKPANRQASVGTKIIHDEYEVAQAWIDCTDHDEGIFYHDRSAAPLMLAEQFVHGPEFSVEMMIHNGRPVFGGVTRKFLFDGLRPIEQGHLHPADIDPQLTERLIGDSARVLDAVGMDTGFVHCEWIVQDGVPHLVECAGRMAGDGIIELVLLAWEWDVVGQFYDVMQGRPLTVPPPPAASHYAAVWFSRSLTAGRVESVDGVEEARAIPGVHSVHAPEPGDEVNELRSSWDRPAMAMAVGPSPEAALAAAQQAIARITMKVI